MPPSPRTRASWPAPPAVQPRSAAAAPLPTSPSSVAAAPPLRATEVKAHFETRLSPLTPADVTATLECPVCSEVHYLDPVLLLPCEHRVCARCTPRLTRCPLCRAPFGAHETRRVDTASLVRTYVEATCRHCSRSVSYDHLHGVRHFCSQRRQAYREAQSYLARQQQSPGPCVSKTSSPVPPTLFALPAATTSTATAGNSPPDALDASLSASAVLPPASSPVPVPQSLAVDGHGNSPCISLAPPLQLPPTITMAVECPLEVEVLRYASTVLCLDLSEPDATTGETLLHRAYERHNQAAIVFLRGAGLSPMHPCGRGLTGIDHALLGVRCQVDLAFVEEIMAAEPDVHVIGAESYALAASRGATVALRFLCNHLRTKVESPRGPLLRRLFHAAISGSAARGAVEIVCEHFPEVENIVVKSAIKFGTVSLINERIARGSVSWEEVVDLVLDCRDYTVNTHVLFASPILSSAEAKARLRARFLRPGPGVRYDVESTIDWLTAVDVASFRMVVYQRELVVFPPASDGTTVLHLAAAARNADVVQLLLDEKQHIPTTDSHMETPLHCACRGARLAIDYLLKRRSQNHQWDGAGGSAEECTPDDQQQPQERVSHLFEREPYRQMLDRTFAHRTIRMLLRARDLSAPLHLTANDDCQFPIHVADEAGRAALRSMLPDHDVNSLGTTGRGALHLAASLGPLRAVDALTTLVNCAAVDTDAVRSEIRDLRLAQRLSNEAEDGVAGRTAQVDEEQEAEEVEAAVRAYVERWAMDVDMPCSDGYRPVHYAAFNHDAAAVEYLLEIHHAQLFDINGQSVLHHAAIAGATDVCRYLLLLYPAAQAAHKPTAARGYSSTDDHHEGRRGGLSVHDKDAFGATALDLCPSPTLAAQLLQWETSARL